MIHYNYLNTFIIYFNNHNMSIYSSVRKRKENGWAVLKGLDATDVIF